MKYRDVGLNLKVDRADFGKIMEGTGTKFGYSGVSAYLSCPERFRLSRLGVQRRGLEIFEDESGDSSGDPSGEANTGFVDPNQLQLPGLQNPTKLVVPRQTLGPLQLGTVIHHLRARFLYLVTVAEMPSGTAYQFVAGEFDELISPHIDSAQALTVREYFGVWYEEIALSRLYSEDMTVLGIECYLEQPIGDSVRSVRYDTIVEESGTIYTIDLKTSKTGGAYAINFYIPQFVCQVALWNMSPYRDSVGYMSGAIPELIVKTKVPKAYRMDPYVFDDAQQWMARRYLTLPDQIQFPTWDAADKSWPKMLHSCYSGKFGACEYVDLCWHNDRLSYTGLPP